MAEQVMRLPKQVEEQARLAEEFMATLNGSTEEDNDENLQGADDDSTAGATAEADEIDTTTAEETEEEERFRKKYETLQGKYNAEVPRLHEELRNLKDQIFERLGSLEAAPKKPLPTEPEVDDFEEELEQYRLEHGSDLLKAIDRIAERRVKSLLQETVGPVAKKVEDVEEAQYKNAQLDFVGAVDERVAEGIDWRALWRGENPEFNAFLDQPDPSGFYTYRELAVMSNNQWNADRLAKIFNAFHEAKAPRKAPDKPGEKPEARKPTPREEARVSPPRTPPQQEPEADEPRIWTKAMIKEFEANDRKGKYDKATSDALWNDLLRAPGEKRVQP